MNRERQEARAAQSRPVHEHLRPTRRAMLQAAATPRRKRRMLLIQSSQIFFRLTLFIYGRQAMRNAFTSIHHQAALRHTHFFDVGQSRAARLQIEITLHNRSSQCLFRLGIFSPTRIHLTDRRLDCCPTLSPPVEVITCHQTKR